MTRGRRGACARKRCHTNSFHILVQDKKSICSPNEYQSEITTTKDIHTSYLVTNIDTFTTRESHTLGTSEHNLGCLLCPLETP